MNPEVKKYLSEIGAKGGRAAKGSAKARSSAQARRAVMARWDKTKAERSLPKAKASVKLR